MKLTIALSSVSVAISLAVSSVWAEPVAVEAVMAPTQSIRMDFKDGSNHFVLMVQREGQVETKRCGF